MCVCTKRVCFLILHVCSRIVRQGKLFQKCTHLLYCSVLSLGGNVDTRRMSIENRIYREEFTRKKCKTAILLYCFHTTGVLHIFILYNLLGPGISFYRKSKIIVIRKPNYEIGWFHNWPMIVSHRLYAFHFTNDDFPL